MFSLVYTRNGQAVRHVLSAGDTVAGRAPVCDLVIDDPSISRRHARFRVHGHRCQVTELGGRNGTFINGRRITEGELVAGDTVTLGHVALAVEPWQPAEVAISARHTLLEAASTVQRLVPGPAAAAPEVAPDLAPRRLLALIRELAGQLVGWRSEQDALDRLASVAFAVAPVDRVFVLLVHPVTGAREPRVSRRRDDAPMGPTTLNGAVIDRVIETREPILAANARLDAPIVAGDSPLRSLACVPLPFRDAVIGVLYADAPHTEPLTPGDLKLLEALGVFGGAVAASAAVSAEASETKPPR